MMWPRVLSISVLLAGLEAAAAQSELPVDLELVLAVDASASMDIDEQRLQRRGYIAAFRSDELVGAIESLPLGRIAVAYVEWGDPNSQLIVVPWTLVDGLAGAEEMANRLEAAPLGRLFGTSIAGALAFSGSLFEENGFAGERLVIDVSGDGPNNIGPPVTPARDAVLARGITINGLPIMLRVSWSGGLHSIAGLDLYFRDCVIGGPGAFAVAVKRRVEFGTAIRRKLLREIMSAGPSGFSRIADRQVSRSVDCLAGEKNSGRLFPAE